MLATLRELFDSFSPTSSPASASAKQHALQLASAVLLVEVTRADGDLASAEGEATLAALRRRFALDDAELGRLVAQAREEASAANDYFRFTNEVNERLGHPEKIALVQSMWEVAYADGALDAHENHVISKVAGLLHVTHGEYIAAKVRAQAAASSR